jgi:hypothetical protein
MGTVLWFTADGRDRVAEAPGDAARCEIVIFPGVRIERQDQRAEPDSSDPPSPGTGKLDGTGGRRRRKTSAG